MIKAILFDFNQTLIHAPQWMDLEVQEMPEQALKELADQNIISEPSPALISRAQDVYAASRRRANKSGVETSHVEDLLEIIGKLQFTEAVTTDIAEATIASLHRRCVPAAELFEGAHRALTALTGAGYRLSVVSNAAYSPFLTWTLDRFGILDSFEHVVVSADVKTRKPWIEIFGIALERMQLSARESVYVGDDFIKDVQASKRAGIRSIWLQSAEGLPSPDQVDTPDARVRSLLEIPEVIESWRES